MKVQLKDVPRNYHDKIVGQLNQRIETLEQANEALLKEGERHIREKWEGIKIVREEGEVKLKESRKELESEIAYGKAKQLQFKVLEKDYEELQSIIRVIKAAVNWVEFEGEDTRR
jgi:hypothetical protein